MPEKASVHTSSHCSKAQGWHVTVVSTTEPRVRATVGLQHEDPAGLKSEWKLSQRTENMEEKETSAEAQEEIKVRGRCRDIGNRLQTDREEEELRKRRGSRGAGRAIKASRAERSPPH